MPGVFVTAIGTDVGKTYVACALVAAARRRGLPVAAYKPVVTGLGADPATWAQSDSGRLLAALGQPPTAEAIAAISPWCFRDPVSPDLAAAREGRILDPGVVAAFARGVVERTPGSFVIVEGIGGVLVPLAGRHTVADVIAAAGLPALLVAATYLGSLSHTLTAYESLRARSIPIRAIAVSESADPGASLDEADAILARYVDVPIVPIPRDDAAATDRAADLLLDKTLV